jgi:hypothetical protein
VFVVGMELEDSVVVYDGFKRARGGIGVEEMRRYLPRKNSYYEREASGVARLGRNELTRRIRHFKGKFKLDFTEDYLNNLSVDRLRHVLLAAIMNAEPHD